jgi:hypothetical protein
VPNEAIDAITEFSLESGLRADVALVDRAGRAVFAIEVYVNSAVTPRKAQKFDVPWIEVDALEYRPREWLVRHSSRAAEFCVKCTDVHARIAEEWSEMQALPEMERARLAELEFRMANLCNSKQLTERAEATRAAQLESLRWCRVPEDERSASAGELARKLNIELLPSTKPFQWLCRRCLSPMLVFAWPDRKFGSSPPHELRLLLGNDDGVWSERCPQCGQLQEVNWYRKQELVWLLHKHGLEDVATRESPSAALAV